MSDASAFGFGKFIPGFDFLQNLSKAGSASSAMPSLTHWVAPTVSVEEVEKRIEELKAVQFWLEQNGRALAATVQALEVQRMTLSTLKSMNVNLTEVAAAFPFTSTAPAANGAASTTPNPLQDWPLSAKPKPSEPAPEAASRKAEPPPSDSATASPKPDAEVEAEAAQATPEADAPSMNAALQWWGALTQQFQHIAQQALKDPAQQQAMLQATQVGTELAQNAMKAASDLVRQATAPVASTTPNPAAAAKPKPKRKATSAQKPVAKKAAAPRKAASTVQKAVLADKKAAPVAAKKKPVAAKKPSTSKTTRSR